MSLFCPQWSLEPVKPGEVQRKGKPAFPAVLATWGSTTKGWESSTVTPIEYCVTALCSAKLRDFCCWTALSVAVKNYLQLSLHKNWEEAYRRIPFIFQQKKTTLSLLVTLKTGCSNGWSNSPHFSAKGRNANYTYAPCQKTARQPGLYLSDHVLYNSLMICTSIYDIFPRMTKISISEKGVRIYCREFFLLLKLPFEEVSFQLLQVTGMYMT